MTRKTQHKRYVPKPGTRPSPRELELLRLLCSGTPQKKARAQLGMTSGTASTHLRRLWYRAGVTNKYALAIWAYRSGYLDPPRLAGGDVRQALQA